MTLSKVNVLSLSTVNVLIVWKVNDQLIYFYFWQWRSSKNFCIPTHSLCIYTLRRSPPLSLYCHSCVTGPAYSDLWSWATFTKALCVYSKQYSRWRNDSCRRGQGLLSKSERNIKFCQESSDRFSISDWTPAVCVKTHKVHFLSLSKALRKWKLSILSRLR
jgi:hypothetical protein